MNLKENILIFSDLDGTALQTNNKFSKELKEIVQKIHDRNFYFIPVTARSTKDAIWTQSIELGLDKLNGIAAANNGTHIYDFKHKKWILESYISKEILKKVFNILNQKKANYRVDFMGDEIRYTNQETESSRNWSETMGIEYKVISNLEEIEKPVNHFTIVLEQEPSQEIQNQFYKDFQELDKWLDITKYTSRVYDFAEKGINKGNVVECVKKYLNLTSDNCTTIAFGDSYNDFSLFQAVDISVAMANAREWIKEIAKYCTLTNNENGVENFIKTHIL